jgi:hypothetical protein
MISNQQTTYTVGQNNQLLASVPAGSLAGPAIVRLFTPAGISLPPVVMQIDIPAPAIAQAANSAGVIGNMDPVSAGETVSLSVAGLADQTGALPPASNVEVNVGGVVTSALGITASGQGLSVVQFTLPSGIPSGPQTVTVQVGTRLSAPYTILVQ